MVKWFQVLLFNTKIKSFIQPIDEAITCTTTPGLTRPVRNGNDGVVQFSLTKSLEPLSQMQFNIIPRILNAFNYCYLTNNFIQHYFFVCTKLNGFKYCYVILIIDGVMINVIENEHGHPSSKPGRGCSHCANTLWERYKSTYSPFNCG